MAAATYTIEIDDPTYSGVIFTIQGKGVLEYPKVKTMDMLRGSVLKMQLEAESSSTWQNTIISTVGDKSLPVVVKKDGVTFWNGFIKPDGIVESFVTDYWIVSIQAIDGLGLLENIKFLNDSGEIYQGAMSELDILTRCLELTGQDMGFRIYYMNLFYTVDATNPVLGNQALETTFVNVDRYVKDDQKGSVFTAKEVLESILKKYGAFICQQDSLWHIVRIIDYYTTDTSQSFALYDSSGNFVTDTSESMNQELGSDIDGYDPCHAGATQSKTYKAALGAYKVYYEYGSAVSLLSNPKIIWDDNIGTISGWTYDDLLYFTFTPESATSSNYLGSISSTIHVPGINYVDALTSSDTINVQETNILNIEIKGILTQNNIITEQFARLKFTGDSGTVYYLNQNGEWTLSFAAFKLFSFSAMQYWIITYGLDKDFKLNIKSNALPEDGTLELKIYRPKHYTTTNTCYSLIENVIIGVENNDGIKGESHTATRNELGLGTSTAIVEIENKVYVGDNDSDTYIGAIENISGDNSVRWCKAPGGIMDTTKQFPLLNWLARDRMQISGGNSTIFKGGILGYLPYLGVHEINNVTGVFMCIAYRHDLKEGTIEAEFERIFTDDIYNDVSVSFDLESDNVIKPAIE